MKGTCFLKMDNGIAYQVDADIFGEWAVHISPDRYTHGHGPPKPARSITHIPSGLRASCSETVGMSKRHAFRIARHLARTIPTGQTADEAFGREVWKQILIVTYGKDLGEQFAKERS